MNIWQIHALTDHSLYLITADYSSTMNGRRSDGFSSLPEIAGVTEGSLKGHARQLSPRPEAEAGRTRKNGQNDKNHTDNQERKQPRPLRARLLMHI